MSVQRIERQNLHFQPSVHLLFAEELRFPAAAKIVAWKYLSAPVSFQIAG
jgi:hypothetical protein